MKRLMSLVLVLVGMLLFSASRVEAQMGAIRRMGGMTTPSMSARHLKHYSQILGLSETQTKAAGQLLSGYEADYLAAVSRLTELQQAMQAEFSQTGDFSTMGELMGDAIKKFRRRTDSIEKSFIDDLKSLLTPDQMSKWPIVERTHRRDSTINWGSLSGESVDVAELVEGLRLDPAQHAALSQTLEQYAVDLDRELVARNKIVDEQVAAWLENIMNPDVQKLQEQMKALREASVKIKDINQRYARLVEGLLPLEAREPFNQKVKLASYPQVYRTPYVLRAFDAAEKLDGVDAPTLEAIKNLRDQYTREVGPANDAWAGAISENELKEEDGLQAMARQFGRQLPEDVQKAKEARDAVDAKALDSLKALLTPEQVKKLPDLKSRPEFDFDANLPAR
ncbi:MAG: hypothetical protein AB7G11_01290 [Phycisphaerales bacterium]